MHRQDIEKIITVCESVNFHLWFEANALNNFITVYYSTKGYTTYI